MLNIEKTDRLVLMMKDIPVIEFSTNGKIFEVVNWDYVPYRLKGRLKVFGYNSDSGEDECGFNNLLEMMEFFSSRVLSLDRENARDIYNLLGLPKLQDAVHRANVSLMFRSLSLLDCYWVKKDSERLAWSDVSLRENSISEVVAHVALHGGGLALGSEEVRTPEISTFGAYAKCWKRENDGLWLYKKGYRGSREAEVEVCVSNLLDKMNVEHVKYLRTSSEGDVCCECKCITDDIFGVFMWRMILCR